MSNDQRSRKMVAVINCVINHNKRYGVFIKALLDELHKRDIKIPIRGIRDSSHETMNEDLEWLDDILASVDKN